MSLVINFCSKGAGELLSCTAALFTQIVILPEVVSQGIIVPIKLIAAVSIAKVAVIMFASQMTKQFIAIQIALVAIFAQGMTTMRTIVGITFGAMHAQLRQGITTPFERENFQILNTKIAIVEIMFFTYMIT